MSEPRRSQALVQFKKRGVLKLRSHGVRNQIPSAALGCELLVTCLPCLPDLRCSLSIMQAASLALVRHSSMVKQILRCRGTLVLGGRAWHVLVPSSFCIAGTAQECGDADVKLWMPYSWRRQWTMQHATLRMVSPACGCSQACTAILRRASPQAPFLLLLCHCAAPSLQGRDFSKQDLQRSNFTAADARDADFSDSNLQAGLPGTLVHLLVVHLFDETAARKAPACCVPGCGVPFLGPASCSACQAWPSRPLVPRAAMPNNHHQSQSL